MIIRPRRLRNGDSLRKMVRETRVDSSSLIYPMFVMDGENKKEEIKKEDIVKYISDYLPSFKHIETGKGLDLKL